MQDFGNVRHTTTQRLSLLRTSRAVLERVDFEHVCFLMAPIGPKDSDVRARSDAIRDYIVKPAVEALDLAAVRADDVARPGQITTQVIDYVLRAKAAVADLTGNNPNVYYELAIRHTAQLPVVLIAEEDHRDKLPFDIAQMRTIFFDHHSLASADDCRAEIIEQLRAALSGAVESPVSTTINVEALLRGTSVERSIAEFGTQIERLSAELSEMRSALRVTPRSVAGSEEPNSDEDIQRLSDLIARRTQQAEPGGESPDEPEGGGRK